MTNSLRPTSRYEALHSIFKEAASIFFKGSTLMLAIFGVAIGYLLQAKLPPVYARVTAGTVLIISLFWYLCSYKCFHTVRSLRMSIAAESKLLDLPHEDRHYSGIEWIIMAAWGCVAPIVAVFVWLLFSPPPGAP